MAEEAMKKLEEQLNCSICLDTYTSPKLLQCFHVYCQHCLVKLVDRDQQGELMVVCPSCRHVTPVPANGVQGLRSAFHINHLLEIQESVKKIQDLPESEGAARGGSGTFDQASAVIMVKKCPSHDKEELKLYCNTCEDLTCLKCALEKDGRHYKHDYQLLNEAFEKYKWEINSSLEPMEKQLAVVNEALKQLDACQGEISRQKVAVKRDVHSRVQQLHEILNTREAELICKLDGMVDAKLKSLATQKDLIETMQARLNSCLDFMKESLKTCDLGEVLKMKPTVVHQVKELTFPFNPDLLKANTEANIVFSPCDNVITKCRHFGEVTALSVADPLKCRVTGKGLEVLAVGEKSTATIHAVNFEGTPCIEPLESLICELVSTISGLATRSSVERKGESLYEVTYQPTIKGRHQLRIELKGQNIRGSPFTVAVRSPIEELNNPVLTIGNVKTPWGVGVNELTGTIAVAERGRHCITTFSPNGEKLLSFGTHGSGHGQFYYPHGVVVDREGNILVTDCYNHRIQKFTERGQFLAVLGSKGNQPLQFYYPSGIAVSASNVKYIADSNNHRIQVLNSDLSFSSTFGKEGSGRGEFSYPRGIACDSAGLVYVTDNGNNRIQVFTADGRFLRMFGRRGNGKGDLDGPTGIAVDASRTLYVSDTFNFRISMFTLEGQFIRSFGKRGEFKYPRGLAVDSSGVLHVCDENSNRIQAF